MKDKVESVNNLSARGVSRQRKIIIAVLAGMCFVGDGQQSYAIGTGGAQVILILVMLELLSLRIELMLNSGRESLLDMLLMLYIML